MRLSARQYADALKKALETTKPDDQEKVLDNFVKILAENGDIRLFEEISEEYHKLELAEKGVKQAEVISANPLDKDTEKAIVDSLNKIAQADVELKKKIDANLIGGCVIRVDDKVIDASIKRSLEQLKSKLTE